MAEAEKKYIIVVEDDQAYANVYQKKLTNEGFEVTIIGDGSQVIKTLQERKPELLLLDLMLPNTNGFEILTEIKKDPNLKELKVVITSNLSQEEDQKKAKSLGAVDYLVKANISVPELIAKIRQYLT
ncbi:MAG TPA: response regulator [Candidatus Dojkabacteria bacterium]|nr:response regulator [Candidatus Dojkabacteria bacterium]